MQVDITCIFIHICKLGFYYIIFFFFFIFQENACARCMLKACVCCLYCLEKCLAFLNQVSSNRDMRTEYTRFHKKHFVFVQFNKANVDLFQNAYTATAINSTNFCSSVCDAFKLLLENAAQVAVINTVGDFVLFMGKVRCITHLFFPFLFLWQFFVNSTFWMQFDNIPWSVSILLSLKFI